MTNSKRESKGRYALPEYVAAIRHMFDAEFPDNVPKDFVIDHCIKYFWKHVEEQLKQELPVDVYAFGKFTCKGKVSRNKTLQYYPKFKFSRHFLLRLREDMGTLTESEQKEINTKREFMQKVWEKRRQFILETRGKIHASLEQRANP